MGTLGACSNITNMMLLQFHAVQCCATEPPLECAINTLGIMQVGIQWLMFLGIFILYVLYFPQSQKYITPLQEEERQAESTGVSGNGDAESSGQLGYFAAIQKWLGKFTVEWRTVMCVVAAAIAHHLICLLFSSLLIIKLGPQAPQTRTWAGFLGIFSLVLTCIQFLPQIAKTWRSRRVGALSIPMMLLQTPGGYMFSYSIAVRPGTNWSSWISTFMAATLQGILLIICIAWWMREKHESDRVQLISELASTDQAEEEEAPLIQHPEAPASPKLFTMNSSSPRKQRSQEQE
ncbi:hypothetical protein H4219_006347 [Mycoemilia scoparia]|uniref:PQ loop repeat protein n=1 Tax=Mycoemilia scoparia TaxID=417184 RepID=A0A9W8DM12_9FUNG|nr:hypothetical protein H4219_006347 [Mycoemilia scoparia]